MLPEPASMESHAFPLRARTPGPMVDRGYPMKIPGAFRSSGLLLALTLLGPASVVAQNTPPSMNQPPDMSVNENTLLTYTLTATDPDGGQTLTFAKVSVPLGLAVTTGGLITWTPTFQQGGDCTTPSRAYTVTVVVTDDGAPPLTDTKSFVITVFNVDRPPLVFARFPSTGCPGQTLTFDATGSVDPDGEALQYTWEFGDAMTGTGVIASHSYASPGTYTARAIVADPCGVTASSSANVTIAGCKGTFSRCPNDNSIVNLKSTSAVCVSITSSDGCFNPGNLVGSTVQMKYQGGSITRDASISSGNNCPPVGSFCFNKTDLNSLFGGLPSGKATVTVTIEAQVAGGCTLAGDLVLDVQK